MKLVNKFKYNIVYIVVKQLNIDEVLDTFSNEHTNMRITLKQI